MNIEINTHASASALAKLLGIDYKVAGEFKEFIEASDLKTVSKMHIIKDKPITYDAYDIMEALTYTYQNFGKLSKESSELEKNESQSIDDEKLDLFLKIDID